MNIPAYQVRPGHILSGTRDTPIPMLSVGKVTVYTYATLAIPFHANDRERIQSLSHVVIENLVGETFEVDANDPVAIVGTFIVQEIAP